MVLGKALAKYFVMLEPPPLPSSTALQLCSVLNMVRRYLYLPNQVLANLELIARRETIPDPPYSRFARGGAQEAGEGAREGSTLHFAISASL